MPSTAIPTQTPVIVLVERECAGRHDPALRRVAEVARGSRVHLVAPAGPVELTRPRSACGRATRTPA